MKKFTQSDFDNFIIDEYGFKICRSGDYTAIKNFGGGCKFGSWCDFGMYCKFSGWSSFGEVCRFGDGCAFAARCKFDDYCKFGEWCNFGAHCNFENGRVINGTYFACDRIGSEKRKTYFFKGDNGYFVRAGCFFDTFDVFMERVHLEYAGTKFEKEYELAIELAKAVLG